MWERGMVLRQHRTRAVTTKAVAPIPARAARMPRRVPAGPVAQRTWVRQPPTRPVTRAVTREATPAAGMADPEDALLAGIGPDRIRVIDAAGYDGGVR